jgi:hypothetical protein
VEVRARTEGGVEALNDSDRTGLERAANAELTRAAP